MSTESVTDDVILEGFRSLHEAMATGFDALRAEIRAEFAASEQRMLRHFDRRDDRLDDHDRRITVLESAS